MSHYLIHIPMNMEDVKVIREEFSDYMTRVGLITIVIKSPSDDEPSVELQDAIRRIFLHVLIALDNDMFEGLH